MKQFTASVQVEPRHYDLQNEGSFLNLFNQVDDVLRIIRENNIATPKILIIGVGDDMLKILLAEKFGYFVRTFDFDEALHPDFVGSVSKLDSIVNEKFDIIVCAHVLEHLPYDYFESSLVQIGSVARYAVVYLPIAQFGFRCSFELYPFFKKQYILLSTYYFKNHHFDGQHYWEIGTRQHPLRDVKKALSRDFRVMRAYNAKNWLYSYNFILETKPKV